MTNNCTILGRLTADPDLRRTSTGTSVCSFCIANERERVNSESGKRDVDYIDVVAWRGKAEFICKYFGKGMMIALTGRMQARIWEDKNGSKHKNTELIVDTVNFTGDRKKESSGESYRAATAPVNVDANDFQEIDEDDGDLPF